MRKFAKTILIVGGLILLLYVLAILGLNIYLQSQGLQDRIRAVTEAAAGSPVRILGTHYTPWSGFSITGISVRGQSGPGQPPFLEAAEVSFRFALLALLQGKLVVSEVVITGPTLVVLQPQPQREQITVVTAAPALQSSPSTPPQTPPAETPPAAVVIMVPEQTPPTPLPPMPTPPAVEVDRIHITNGKVQFYDSKGALALTLTGVEISSEIKKDRSFTGTFLIADASVGAYVHPNHIHGTFSWRDNKLNIPDLKGDWAGGQLTGTLQVGQNRDFSSAFSTDGILIKKIAEDAGINGDGSRGSLFSKGTLQGTAGKPETFTGNVDVSLQQARFQPLDFIRQIGDLMNIQELQMLELKTAVAGFQIHDKKVSADPVVLESENLVIDAKGPIKFDGKMKLQARLLLNERLRKDLAGLLGNNFKPSEREGYQQMPFSITGTISRPETDLLDKLTGFRIGKDVGGLLKNLFKAPPEQKKEDLPAGKLPGGG